MAAAEVHCAKRSKYFAALLQGGRISSDQQSEGPSEAPMFPPVTGQSSTAMPRADASGTSPWQYEGASVLMTINMEPDLRA